MLHLELPGRDHELSLLVLGAHPDDIEIGCGGTLLRLRAEYPRLRARWVVFTAEGERVLEAQGGARAFLGERVDAEVHHHRDGFLQYEGAVIKQRFEDLKADFQPELVLAPSLEDRHQDHRFLAELVWQTFRDALVLEYEIPKYDGDLGRPTLYVHLERTVAEEKVRLLGESFPSQRDRDWFTPETFSGLMRLRGIESRAPDGYAEAFYARKLVI